MRSRLHIALIWLVLLPCQALAQTTDEPPAGDDATEEDGADAEVPWYQQGQGGASDAEGAESDGAAETPDREAEEESGEPAAPEAEDGDEAEEEDEPDPNAHRGDFHFGSYGRVIAASDLEGRSGQQANIIAWGPRVDESDTYAEIELRREDHFAGMHTIIVATLAYAGPLFHYDGEFSERIAIRNLFAETRDLLTPGLSIWAGSRMWRGDDIYLLNFWPLDSLNMVGGGLRYALTDIGELSIAGGLAQPNDPFQRQELLVPGIDGFSPETVLFLDRPRGVLAAKLTWWPFGRFAPTGAKAILYYEQHILPAGERQNEEGFIEPLPEDLGFAVGAQFGAYISESRTFANVFVRYARGLAAYDPLGVPFREGSVIQTGRAEELRLALSANWEVDIFGLQVGAYYRYFRDADPNVFERGALSEGVLDVRPHVWLDRYVGVAADVSIQAMQASAISEVTGNPEGGVAFKLALMPFVSPFGRGTYTRPHIRLIYSMTVRDEGARALYPALDRRSQADVEHFLGVGVEWWFSSTSYAP